MPPVALEPGSCEYNIALVANEEPFTTTSFLIVSSLLITFCSSSSETLGLITICASSSSAPKTGLSYFGIEKELPDLFRCYFNFFYYFILHQL